MFIILRNRKLSGIRSEFLFANSKDIILAHIMHSTQVSIVKHGDIAIVKLVNTAERAEVIDEILHDVPRRQCFIRSSPTPQMRSGVRREVRPSTWPDHQLHSVYRGHNCLSSPRGTFWYIICGRLEQNNPLTIMCLQNLKKWSRYAPLGRDFCFRRKCISPGGSRSNFVGQRAFQRPLCEEDHLLRFRATRTRNQNRRLLSQNFGNFHFRAS